MLSGLLQVIKADFRITDQHLYFGFLFGTSLYLKCKLHTENKSFVWLIILIYAHFCLAEMES